MSGIFAAVRDHIVAFLADPPFNSEEYMFFDTTGMSPVPQPGWILDPSTGNFSPPAPPVVAEPVTPAQAHIALSRAGLLDTVNAYIAALTGQDGLEVQIWWAKAEEIRRDNPHLAAVAAELGLTSDQIDDLFRIAATIS